MKYINIDVYICIYHCLLLSPSVKISLHTLKAVSPLHIKPS